MEETNQTGTSIRAVNAQELLESATNAADKGASSFYTPIEFGKLLSRLLPDTRTNIVDLTSGNGQLLLSAANESTKSLLGVDIDPVNTVKHSGALTVNKITGDITNVWQLLKEVNWTADLFVLNPPYSLKWKRERLAALSESKLPAVRDAFRAGGGAGNRDNVIDSTVATLMLALELGTHRSEGFLIANNATLKKLLFNPDARYRHLVHHVWMYHVLDGNPMTDSKGSRWEEKMETGIIWFARDDTVGIDRFITDDAKEPAKDMAELEQRIERRPRHSYRTGQCIYSEANVNPETRKLWQAVKDEHAIREKLKPHSAWNLRLATDGTIDTNLSLFESRSVKVDKAEVEKLHALRGQRPMNLVLQKASRLALLEAVKGGRWRVDPQLPAAVDEAIRKYNLCRAPLYQMPAIQRLGFIDEEETLRCSKDIATDGFSKVRAWSGALKTVATKVTVFTAGRAYPVRTQSVKVSRFKTKPNSIGKTEEFYLAGQELAIFVTGDDHVEHLFMEARHMAAGVDIKHLQTVDPDAPALKPEFPLDKLAEHFAIPEVKDVAEMDPEGFARAKTELAELEMFMNEIAH